MVIKESSGDKVFSIVIYIILTIFFLLVLYPLLYVIAASVSDPKYVTSGQMWLIPMGFTLEGYTRVLVNPDVLNGFKNSLIYTGFGTLAQLVCTLTAAYALSKKKLPGRRIFSFLILLTMYFQGGLIPTYLLYKSLHIMNTVWVMVLPGLVGVYNLIIARTFFASGVSPELEEAAYIDGCSTTRSFVSIVLPLAKSIIAVLALYYIIAHWNAYFSAMIYLTNTKMYPLATVLQNILVQNQLSSALLDLGTGADIAAKVRMGNPIKYSVIVVSSIPLIILYPFIQRFFVKGVMIGSLKG